MMFWEQANSETPLHATLSRAIKLVENYDYTGFFKLFEQEKDNLVETDLGEMHYICAHIKLLCLDMSLSSDLKTAAQLLPQGSRFAPLLLQEPDTIPTLIPLYHTRHASLASCRNAFVRSPFASQKCIPPQQLLTYQLFDASCSYYVGNIPKALRIVRPVYEEAKRISFYSLVFASGFLLTRCYVEQGNGKIVRKLMLELKNSGKNLPDTQTGAMYASIESWLNSVTGWMGKVPRFYNNPGHGDIYSLDVYAYYTTRTIYGHPPSLYHTALQKADAEIIHGDTRLARDVELDIYESLLLFKYVSPSAAADHLYRAYRYTISNRIVMPFVEYGARIIPLIKYIRSSHDGRFAVTWLDKIQRLASQYEKTLTGLISNEQEQSVKLTSKEKDVLALLAKGMKNSDISVYMGISPSTTKDYTRKIYRKMGVKSRTEAVLLAQSMKLV